jgi:hypothetical protein
MKSILAILFSVLLIGSSLQGGTPIALQDQCRYLTPAPPDSTDTLTVGCATIIQHHNISTLVDKHIAHNSNQKMVDGFRVEIFLGSGNDGKTGAGKARTEFLTAYPDVKAYLAYNQPNYSIRVGDFKERIDAVRFLQKIKEQYPDALLVREKVTK